MVNSVLEKRLAWNAYLVDPVVKVGAFWPARAPIKREIAAEAP
jgi:hypothetical protein